MVAGSSVLTTMRHALLLLAGYCFLPMAASMAGNIPFRGKPHTLYPTVHPDTNRADLSHIKGGEGLTMHYHDPYAAFPEIRSFATVQVSGFIHPVILLEHSAHVTSTQCDATTSTITVTFGLRSVWAAALEDWKQHEKFLLIAYEDSCGLGRSSGERSVHLVHNFTSISDKMQIVAHMSEVPMTDAIHPDREVFIQVTTFDKHDTAPPTPSSAQIIRRSPQDGGSPPQNSPPDANDEDYEVFAAMFRGDPPDDYISAEDLADGTFDGTLVPGADSLGLRALEARGRCLNSLKSFNPFAILTNCFALPILRAALPENVYRIFENLADGVLSVLQKVLDAIAEKIDDLLAKSAYTASGEVTFDTNKTLPLTNTSEFGWSYPLVDIPSIKYTGQHPGSDGKPSDKKNSIAGSFRMDCVGCRINGWMKYRSEFRFTLRNSGLINAVVEIVDGSLDVAVGVGIKFDLALNHQLFEGNIFKIGITPNQLPGIIIIGPFISLDVAFGVEIGASGTFIAKTSMGWSNMAAKLDLTNAEKSTLALVEKTPASQVSLDFEARLVATPSITAGLLFGVTILNGKLEASAGVEAKASLPLTVAVAGTVGTNQSLTFRDCGGVQVSVVAKFAFYAIAKATAKGISNGAEVTKSHPLFDYPVPLFDKCFPIGETRSTTKLRADVVPPNSSTRGPQPALCVHQWRRCRTKATGCMAPV
ncbi:hypothetical protein B0H14DRAFT_772762 [Mycena olivaceomarginata]|nr:hypothetical protein B0H14DRAFT_772762 [Mycena olivaceomarginata]